MRVLNLIVGLGFSLLFPSSSLFFFFFFFWLKVNKCVCAGKNPKACIWSFNCCKPVATM